VHQECTKIGFFPEWYAGGPIESPLVSDALDHLRRLPEGTKKRPPHSVAISKPVLFGDLVGRESASLRHQPGGLYTQPFNCLGGRPFITRMQRNWLL
jgi:hypothetical protein